MIEKVVVSMAQLNQTAGDLEGNFKRIAEAAEKAKHSDILVTPELSLCGYPPEDLLFLDSFLEDCAKKLNELVEYSTRFPKLHILAGYPLKEAGRLYNVVSVILNGKFSLLIERRIFPTTVFLMKNATSRRAEKTSARLMSEIRASASIFVKIFGSRKHLRKPKSRAHRFS